MNLRSKYLGVSNYAKKDFNIKPDRRGRRSLQSHIVIPLIIYFFFSHRLTPFEPRDYRGVFVIQYNKALSPLTRELSLMASLAEKAKI